jgi:mannitol/fructose-specific phosphotransferase system IIA component (Ntr-type)
MSASASQLLLADLLPVERIRVPLESTDKRGLIEELCGLLRVSCGASPEDEREILDAVLAREAVLSTGIGGGVAIPHGKSEAVGDLVLVAGRTRSPVDFDSLDERPVSIVLLLVGPESAAGLHVKALSRISRVLRSESLRERLVAAETAIAFHDALRAAEAL